MVRIKSIFEDKTTDKLQAIEILFGLIIILIVSWLSVNNTEVAPVVTSLWGIVVLIVAIWAVDISNEKNKFTESIGFGNKKQAIAGLIGGLVFVFVFIQLFGQSQLIVPFALTSIAWLAVLVAFLEEMFFRSTLIPTFARLLSNFSKELGGLHDYIAIGLGSLLFGVFHWLAYGASIQLIWVAVLFSVLMVVGNYYFKSTTFGYTAHALYNFIVIGGLMLLC